MSINNSQSMAFDACSGAQFLCQGVCIDTSMPCINANGTVLSCPPDQLLCYNSCTTSSVCDQYNNVVHAATGMAVGVLAAVILVPLLCCLGIGIAIAVYIHNRSKSNRQLATAAISREQQMMAANPNQSVMYTQPNAPAAAAAAHPGPNMPVGAQNLYFIPPPAPLQPLQVPATGDYVSYGAPPHMPPQA